MVASPLALRESGSGFSLGTLRTSQRFLDTNFWPKTAAAWLARLGIPLKWGVICDNGGLPYADFIGSGDMDTVAGSPNLNAQWFGFGNDTCLQQVGVGTQTVGASLPLLWAPGVGTWSLLLAFGRGPLTDNNNSGLISSGGINAGIRIIQRVGDVNNWIFASCENQSNAAFNCIVQDGPGFEVDCYSLFSRVSSTRLDHWTAEEGAGTIFHEDNLAITALDDLDGSSVIEMLAGGAVGSSKPDTRVKAALFSLSVGTPDIFDAFRGTDRTMIIEA